MPSSRGTRSASADVRTIWGIRKRLWSALLVLKFRFARPLAVPVPPPFERSLLPVPLEQKFPNVPIKSITVSNHVPIDEEQKLALRFSKLQTWLARHASPMQPGLPQIDKNPYDALFASYTKMYRKRFRVPYRAPGLDGDDPDLGELARNGLYACYLQHAGGSTYVWDLRSLNGPEVHPGLMTPWAHVTFEYDAANDRLSPTSIESSLSSSPSTPASADWPLAQRLAVCAATTHLSLVRHFNWLHLIFGGPLAMATRNFLPGGHPLRRILQPHVYATQSSNQFVTYVQMDPAGDFESVYSYTHDGVCQLFEATQGGFDLRMINPDADRTFRQGASPLESDTYRNRKKFLDLFVKHARRYLRVYYTDTTIENDKAINMWVAQLRTLSPGVNQLLGRARTLTVNGVANLVASIIYMATVEHEIVDSCPWDYQLWYDVNPVRIYDDGRRPPLDLFHRLVNFNFNLQTPRTMLMNDFSGLALDPKGAEAFRDFLGDLNALQRSIEESEPWEVWRLEPRRLRANINA